MRQRKNTVAEQSQDSSFLQNRSAGKRSRQETNESSQPQRRSRHTKFKQPLHGNIVQVGDGFAWNGKSGALYSKRWIADTDGARAPPGQQFLPDRRQAASPIAFAVFKIQIRAGDNDRFQPAQ